MTESNSDEVLNRLRSVVKRWPTPETKAEAERIICNLCSRSDVRAVVVFGSAVRVASMSFDLDLVYIYDKEKPDFGALRMDIDLRGYSFSKVPLMIQQRHDLMCWAIKFGEVVCEKGRYWSDLVNEWQGILPLPSALVAERRATKAWDLFSSLFGVGDTDAALEQFITYLTHKARAHVTRAGVYPASRPELPQQLREVNAAALADLLEQGLRRRNVRAHGRDNRTYQFLAANHRPKSLARKA